MKQSTRKLTPDQQFFDDNLDIWLQDATYNRKFVVISNQQLQAVYDNGGDAYHYAMENFQPGEFIIKRVISRKEAKVRLSTPYYLFPNRNKSIKNNHHE